MSRSRRIDQKTEWARAAIARFRSSRAQGQTLCLQLDSGWADYAMSKHTERHPDVPYFKSIRLDTIAAALGVARRPSRLTRAGSPALARHRVMARGSTWKWRRQRTNPPGCGS